MITAEVAAAVSALDLGPVEVTAITGGIANRSFRLRASGQDLVLKFAGDSTDALCASPRSELAMHTLAARAGLAPPLVMADPARGYIVSRHAPGRTLSSADFGDAQLLRRVGAWIAALHALHPPSGLPAVDFGERAAGYLARVVEQGDDPFAADLFRELGYRRAALPAPGRLTACHHDLHHRNFIDDGERLLAVDWEYAGPGDPAADLASCVGYHGLDGAAFAALLDGYGAQPPLVERIAAIGWIFDCLWYAWNAAAELAGLAPDPAEQLRLAARLAH